jgi:rhamnose utilization protein RhaD (predicted bifunctional aldolase and dehydrogenase)
MSGLQALPADFLRLSARLGKNPLQVQGPGGNTSIKIDGLLWIKASGTELAEAEMRPIFVPVDRAKALDEARGAGDGTCMACLVDPSITLRPSIETTFHALIEWPVVVHIHSVVTLAHGISPEGRAVAREKLAGLPVEFIPYRKPGRPLTERIADNLKSSTQIWVLENHGLICAGPDVATVAALVEEVERRLDLPPSPGGRVPSMPAPEGFEWHEAASILAQEARLSALAANGSLYPDHVVFLGPALPLFDPAQTAPASIVAGQGVLIRRTATAAQRAMTGCLADLLRRLPAEWSVETLSAEQEAELLNWDAEKYRQALAARGSGA